MKMKEIVSAKDRRLTPDVSQMLRRHHRALKLQ
jgi:hypothetical protein